jgi:hypothetical protein
MWHHRVSEKGGDRAQHLASFCYAQGIPDMSHIVAAGGKEWRGSKNIFESQIQQMARPINETNISNITIRQKKIGSILN